MYMDYIKIQKEKNNMVKYAIRHSENLRHFLQNTPFGIYTNWFSEI